MSNRKLNIGYMFILLGSIALLACGDRPSARSIPRQDQPSTSSTNTTPSKAPEIEGVYEFVSRTTTITAPRRSEERLVAPEWYGLWIFHNGYFSQTRMKNIRPDWTPAQFPSNPQGLGFDGGSGTYVIKGETIELDYHVNFYPGRMSAVEDLKYSLDASTLTLTWTMVPGPEFGSTGERVTVLRRIK